MKRNGCAIKGNIDEQIINQPHIKKSRNVEIRNALDLFVNVLHCKSVEGVKTRHDNVDVVVVRQNTEGKHFYWWARSTIPKKIYRGLLLLNIKFDFNFRRICNGKSHGND